MLISLLFASMGNAILQRFSQTCQKLSTLLPNERLNPYPIPHVFSDVSGKTICVIVYYYSKDVHSMFPSPYAATTFVSAVIANIISLIRYQCFALFYASLDFDSRQKKKISAPIIFSPSEIENWVWKFLNCIFH